MQSFNNPAPPPHGGYGMPPPPPAKKGMPTGVKVLVVALALVLVGGIALVALVGGGVYLLTRRAQEAASAARPPLTGLTGAAAADAEPPRPTAEQRSAVAGGQPAAWEQQGISWTVPQRWKKSSAESASLVWRSPGSWDAASLIVNVSPMSADFPEEVSLKAFYAGAEQRRRSGEVAEVRWLKLGGVRGVMLRESAPESADNPQRLQWMGYRDYRGQKQFVSITLASRGKDFARHEDAMHGILYSTELGR